MGPTLIKVAKYGGTFTAGVLSTLGFQWAARKISQTASVAVEVKKAA